MLLALLRWLGSNLSTLLLAFILSVVVWVSAVVTTDPNEQNTFRAVPIEVIGLDSDLMMINESEIPAQVRLTLEAPRTIWNQLNANPGRVRAWIDLSGLEAGRHTVPVRHQIEASPVRVIRKEPAEATVVLEAQETRVFPVQLDLDGDPPLGYRIGAAVREPSEVTISGPRSLVSQVAEARAILDISGVRETRRISVPVEAINENGDPIPGLTITPRTIDITQPVSLEGGFKNVVVRVTTTGTVASGYRLTNLSVTPPNVTVVSANPQLVDELPGFVETMPVDLDNLTDDIERRVALNLADGISLVGEQSVLVQVGVAAIESSLTMTIPVETLGLPPELAAIISPPSVDLIVLGPLPVLDSLTPASFRAVVDLTGLAEGDHQISPVVDLIPPQVQAQSVIPDAVEVTILVAPTPTPTEQVFASPAAPLPTPTATAQP